jgi:hypothetical protein
VVPRRVADIVEVVVLAAGAHAFLGRRGARASALLGAGEHVLNWTIPALVNINVGSLRGTRGDETASWPFCEELRNAT